MQGIGLSTEQVSLILMVGGAADVAGKILFATFGDYLPCLKLYVKIASSFCGAVISGFLMMCSTFVHAFIMSVGKC